MFHILEQVPKKKMMSRDKQMRLVARILNRLSIKNVFSYITIPFAVMQVIWE